MPGISLENNGKRLRIYISESDRWRGKSLDSALLETFRKLGLAGASVFRGIGGFGAQSRVQSAAIEVLSFDLPIVVEVIDAHEKIAEAVEAIYPMVREGLITVEDVEIVKYTHRYLNPLPADRLVSEVMTRNVVSIHPGASVHEAWKRMIDEQVKVLPVVDDAGRVTGILTDEDLTERAGIRQRLSIALRMDKVDLENEFAALRDSRLSVAELMTTPVVTALDSETLGEAANRLIKHELKRLPVVNADGKLVGILARLDVLRQAAHAAPQLPQSALPQGSLRVVKDVMLSDIPMVLEDETLSDIVDKFAQMVSHRLIVVDFTGRVTGLISDSDVVTRVQPSQKRSILDALKNIGNPPAGKETAADLMSPGVLAVSPDTPITTAIKQMLDKGRKWMVVVDEAGRPLGLVDRQALLRSVAPRFKG